MIGQTIAHYEIQDRLGGGGMGVVYKAKDIRLKRPVALKFLPHDLTRDAKARERFVHEAQAASALDHPNICTIYEIDETEQGQIFIAMAYYQGQTLKKKIAGGPLPVEQAVEIAIQLAQGLERAHEVGIIHRDIKPANVMVTDRGLVKILDFGLAKVVDVSLTKTGSTLGTVAYMSPEQSRGESVDQRTDIWAFGVLLYEMLTGELPFKGHYEQAVIYSIMNEDPIPVAELNPDVPKALVALVEKAFEKDPADRHQNMTALIADLKAVTAPAEPQVSKELMQEEKPEISIAVLPFSDLSPARDQEYFCEGMAEEIINALVKVEAVRVASRKSAFQFKTAEGHIREIGQRLGVNTILEGSVRKAANRLRVTIQLIDVENDHQLWSEKYDRELEDVFAVQDEIAEKVVEALKLTLSPEEKQAIEKAPTLDLQAYDYYLRGRYFLYRWGIKNLELTIQMFNKAIKFDPHYALAYAGIADAQTVLYSEFGKNKDHLEQALSASKKAVELDPQLAEAHSSRGIALSWDSRYEAAEKEFEHATQLNRNLFEAHYFWARANFAQGKLEDAARHYEDAAKARPEDYQAFVLVSNVYNSLGRQREATESRKRALGIIEKHLELNPDDVRARYFGAACMVSLNQLERGLEWLRRVLEMDPEDPDTLYNAACVYSLAGQIEAAIECLEKTLELGMAKSKEWVTQDSDLDPLRDHPRFETFLQQLK